MATLLDILYISSFHLLIFSAKCHVSGQGFIEEVSNAVEMMSAMKTCNLHFYFHDTQTGKNPTSMKIIATENPGGFGTTFMVDDTLTQGPEPNSKLVGRAQGMFSFVGLERLDATPTLLMVMNFVFIAEKYHQGSSSISIVGRNHVMDETREMPVVGGSGLFRLARGFALARTISYNMKTGDAVVEYNVTIQHF